MTQSTIEELELRVRALENNVNANTVATVAIMSYLSSLPETANADLARAKSIATASAEQQVALTRMLPEIHGMIDMIIGNARTNS